jgi:Ca2+-binding EF-hand superfamily protein
MFLLLQQAGTRAKNIATRSPHIMRRISFFLVLLLFVGFAQMAPMEPEADAEATHSEEEIREAREEFESIDTNKDGFITREEILEMEEVPEREEIDEFFSTYDSDGDGRVTFDEILSADDELLKAGHADAHEENAEL